MKIIVNSPSVSKELLVAEVADRFIEEIKQGQTPSIEDYADAHPEIAVIIRQVFPALALLENLTAPRALEQENDDVMTGQLGDFRILREIGRGGMGVVYEAEQISLGRRVALKVLPFAAMLDKHQLNRFKNEARAAGTLDHPNIVAIYSVGCERGVHFYAMQLIDGRSLAEVVAAMISVEARMAIAMLPAQAAASDELAARTVNTARSTVKHQRTSASSSLPDFASREYYHSVVRLGIQAAEALDHSHQNGILHRDIKPANLLIDDTGKLWVADFGLARIEQDAAMTVTGEVLGTLRYMSPEQALAKRVVVDHRSDIYSLGVTLYELVTLRPAYSGSDRQELMRQIAFDEPRRPRAINARIPQDLETIILKAIEKSPNDRYRSAGELASDLQRCLHGDPIKARPATLSDRILKWSRRNVALIWGALGIAVAAIVILGISTALVVQSGHVAEEARLTALHERDIAVNERKVAKRNQYYAEIVSGQTKLEKGNLSGLQEKLIRHLPVTGEQDRRGWEWYFLYSFCHPELRAFRQPELRRSPQSPIATFARWSPDGEYLATPGAIWNTSTFKCTRLISQTCCLLKGGAWSPDSQKFAWGTSSDDNAIYIWDRQTDKVETLRGHDRSVWCVAFSPDSLRLVSGSLDHSLKLWDIASGGVVRTLRIGDDATDVAWSPDGLLIAVGVRDGLRIYCAESGNLVNRRDAPEGDKVSISWCPDGSQLAVRMTRSWYTLKRADWQIALQHEHPRGVGGDGHIDWHPDGKKLAVAECDEITVWDTIADHAVKKLRGHVHSVISVDWSPDGHRLVSTDEDGEIRIWDWQLPIQPPEIKKSGGLKSLSWTQDDETLVTVSDVKPVIQYWNAVLGTEIMAEKPAADNVHVAGTLSPDHRLIATMMPEDKPRMITVTDASTGAVHAVLRPHDSASPSVCAWSPDSSRLAIWTTSTTHRGLECWDVRNEQLISHWSRKNPNDGWNDDTTILAWSPNGSCVAIVGWGDVGDNGSQFWLSHVHVIDVATGRRLFKHAFGSQITVVGWNGNSRNLAVGSFDGGIEVVDLETRTAVATFKASNFPLCAVAWSPDGLRLAAGSYDGNVTLWEPVDGTQLLELSEMQSVVAHLAWSPVVAHLAWSPDGQKLAAASVNGQIHVWDASRAYEFDSGGTRIGELAWAYYQLANQSRGDETDQTLQHVLDLAPKELGFRELRGAALARLRRFGDAAREFGSAAMGRSGMNQRLVENRLYALLGDGDLNAFRDLHAALAMSRATSTNLSDRVVVIAFLGTLVPNTTTGFEENVELVRKVTPNNTNENSELTPMIHVPYGAMLFRLGHDQEAETVLSQVRKQIFNGQDNVGRFYLACTNYFLSMARHRLGHTVPARRLFDEARAIDEELQADPSFKWARRVALDTLRREAQALTDL